MNNAERNETINQLRANMAAIEAQLAAVPADMWVILWGDTALKTDGERVGMFGPRIYCGSAARMKEAAQHFAATAEREFAKNNLECEPVCALPAPDALALVKAKNAELLAAISKMGS